MSIWLWLTDDTVSSANEWQRYHMTVCPASAVDETGCVCLLCVVPGPPKALSISVIGATHFVMEWIPPEESNGHIIGYHFSYQSSKMTPFVSLFPVNDIIIICILKCDASVHLCAQRSERALALYTQRQTALLRPIYLVSAVVGS